MTDSSPFRCSRRTLLRAAAGSISLPLLPFAAPLTQGVTTLSTRQQPTVRTYHVCLAPDVIVANPDLLSTVHDAGCSHVWLGCFFYGHWPYPKDLLRQARQFVERAGMNAQAVDVPLGHPGDSLGASSDGFPLTPPKRWKLGVNAAGQSYAGTSLHPPATQENAKAVAEVESLGFTTIFVDDDFRLARGPGIVGGCFCDEHRRAFLEQSGFTPAQWNTLRADAQARNLTSELRAWIEYTCDQLTACFRAQQKTLNNARMGIMVMYLGAEKAGIRLPDYRDVPLRVGELHFDDGSFGSVKGKTSELFSALFHRRFVRPELAYSETTAYPANRLSARNMAAKLAVSTIADVRNSMFMSGLTPFPATHWAILGPAMKRQTELHGKIAGHELAGPFKHFWGEPSRYVGDDNPNSLFLAAGIPFAVCDHPPADGWTFLSQQDADAVGAGRLKSSGTTFVMRPGSGKGSRDAIVQPETMEDVYALKRRVLPQLNDVPYVREEKPVVCAWYPTANAVVLWNLSEREERFTVSFKTQDRSVAVSELDTTLVPLA